MVLTGSNHWILREKVRFLCTIGGEYVFRGTTEPCGERYFASVRR